MAFLIDTDICSAHLKEHSAVTSRFVQHSGRLHVSVVTVGELYTWALRSAAPEQREQSLGEFLRETTVVGFTESIAREYGKVRAELFDAGTAAPDPDLMIAATALALDLTLVTHNTKDFANVPGLRLEDWLAT